MKLGIGARSAHGPIIGARSQDVERGSKHFDVASLLADRLPTFPHNSFAYNPMVLEFLGQVLHNVKNF